MSLDKYLMTIRKLNNMGRWATEYMHQRPTVSEHSFSVTQIGQMLGLIEEQHGTVIDWRRLYSKLLNHDVIESITGDILSTTKHKSKEMKVMVDKIEQELCHEVLLAGIDEDYRNMYEKILFDGKDDSVEGKILSCADGIDALIECINEIKLNNCYPFKQKYNVILESIKQCDLYSSKYFLENILPGLIIDCERLQEY